MGNPIPKWDGKYYQSGKSYPKVGNPIPKWEVLSQSGKFYPKVGNPIPKWEIFFRPFFWPFLAKKGREGAGHTFQLKKVGMKIFSVGVRKHELVVRNSG